MSLVDSILRILSSSSKGNSRFKTVGASDSWTWTGDAEYNYYPDVAIQLKTDQDGTLYIEISPDGTNWDTSASFTVNAGLGEYHKFQKGARYFRVRFVNTVQVEQSYFRCRTTYGIFGGAPTLALSTPAQQDSDAITARTFSDETAIMTGKFIGYKLENKQGRNPNITTTPADIWNGLGAYTGFPTETAEEFEVSSSSSADTHTSGTGAWVARFYYLDANYIGFDSSGNYLYFDVNLNGTNWVSSGQTGMRIWKIEVILSGTGQTNAGDITIRWKSTTANIFAKVPAGFGQSQLGLFTIPAGYTGYLISYGATMDDNNANRAQMVIRSRKFGTNTFNHIRPFIVSTSAPFTPPQIKGGIPLSEKTDIIFRATSVDNTGGIVNVYFDLLLRKN